MLPVPPLDGSRLALMFLPDNIYFGVMKYERIIMILFFVFLYFIGFDFIGTICSYISYGMVYLVSLIPGLADFQNAPALFNWILYN